MKIAIITFIVGNDYKRCMNIGIQTKIDYAKKHGYDFYYGGEDVWERSRPIPWSKLKYIEKFLNDSKYEYDYLFVSDADVMITNDEIKLESFIDLMEDKDLMWNYDICDHYNSGNMFIKVSGKDWIRRYFEDVWKCEELIHHLWWENAGMIKMYQTNEEHRSHIMTCKEGWLFNGYLFDEKGKNVGSSRRLWRMGDFLIHFAGVYYCKKIEKMMTYIQNCLEKKMDPDRVIIETLLKE